MASTIERISVKAYRVPLASPIDLGGTVIKIRRGALVEVALSSGARGLGDVAPLPEFSPDSLDEALQAVRACRGVWIGSTVSPRLDDILHLPAPSAPSARFGLLQAALSAVAHQQGTSMATLLRPGARSTVSLNALLMGTPDELVAAGRELLTGPEGYRAVKIKVGRQDPEAEARAIARLHNLWGEEVAIRLDANRAWTVPQADRFARQLGDTPINYLEEPLSDPRGLREWSARTGIPVALDETTREQTPEALAIRPFAAAFVVKPSLLGLADTLRLAKSVRPAGVDLVISSAYESGVGLAGLVMLASALGDRDVPAGLDTYSRLRRDVVHPRLPIAGPRINVDDLWNAVPDSLDEVV